MGGRTVVIGETSDRVGEVARGAGLGYYTTPRLIKNIPENRPRLKALKYQLMRGHNAGWILMHRARRTRFVDLGIDRERRFRGPFYAMEDRLLGNYPYRYRASALRDRP